MYLIAGLGNPGKQYEATRHNMGFDTIDCLVEKHNIPQGGVKFNAMYGKSIIGGEKAILMKPLSYMNLSGGPIQEMSSYFKIDPETELIVIYDDIDLEPGQLRIRKKGSAGGHNGIKDIIRRLGTEKFIRIRVGVGVGRGIGLAAAGCQRQGHQHRKSQCKKLLHSSFSFSEKNPDALCADLYAKHPLPSI